MVRIGQEKCSNTLRKFYVALAYLGEIVGFAIEIISLHQLPKASVIIET